MFAHNNRAFKEWAVACAALRTGQQTLLIRKGGIREDGGVFTMSDSEFFLMPTFEHQNESLLQDRALRLLESTRLNARPNEIVIDTYAVVDTILHARTETQINAVANEMIWNAEYVRQRFDFNPYDPLFLVVLRAYRLAEPVIVPNRDEYGGCRSWVTLDRMVDTRNAEPALPDEEFLERRAVMLERLATEA